MILGEVFQDKKTLKKLTSRLINMPEPEFMKIMDAELHWKLTLIRKNQYIVN